MLLRAALLAVPLVTLGCGAAAPLDARASTRAGAITDGALGTQSDVGATVSLFMFGESGCTGTLITPRVVVTAAHCVADVDASQLAIVVGAVEPSTAPASARLAVVSAVAHPDFSFFGAPSDDPDGLADERDIGVVVLAADAPIAPAAVLHLADVDARMTEGSDVVIAGYGLTSSDESSADYGRLYVATTPYRRRGLSEFIAGGPGTPDSCNGDSGGPAYVVVDGVKHLAGITSRATLTGGFDCGSGGIYTLFAAFEGFVAEASGGLYESGGDDVDLPPPPPPGAGGTCADSCGEAAPDFSCFCNVDCLDFEDCCADFEAQCPAVAGWTCSPAERDDDACSCDCGTPDPACGPTECAPPAPPPPADDDDDGGDGDNALDPAGDEGAAGCSAAHAGASLAPFAVALLLAPARRRRGW